MKLTEKILVEASVNPHSLLATDYLNVFNEALMLMGMAADDPEMLEELEDWSAPDYIDHFEQTNFKGKDVVAAAFEAADSKRRDSFVRRSKTLELLIQTEVAVMMNSAAEGILGDEEVATTVDMLQTYAAKLDGLIHAGGGNSAQDAADALFD